MESKAQYVVYFNRPGHSGTDFFQSKHEANRVLGILMSGYPGATWTGRYAGTHLSFTGRTVDGEQVSAGMYEADIGGVDLPTREQDASAPADYDREQAYGAGC